MTKLESIEHKIFASEAPLDEIGQFGSALDTTKLNTKDVTTIQALPAYTKGWGSAIISDSNYPTMEEMNGVLNVMSYHTGYLYQEGMPAWRSDREYSATSIVKEPTGTKFFHSLKDGNIGNNLYDTEWWEELKLGGGGLEVCDIGMALYVDETKGLRRYLNGQIVDINTNTQAFLNRLLKIKDTNPDYFTTESNWQAEKTMNIDGCVYKFVLNYDSTGTNVISVRLPKYPDYVELNNNSINNTAPVAVYGNGKTLGLTSGSAYAGLSATYQDSANYPQTLANFHTLYGANAGTASPSNVSRAGIQGVSLGITPDPSKSGLAGTATITSNFRQTKLKLRYFIQIATGQETENNIVNEIELNNPSFFGDSKYVPTAVNNLSWLKSEGQNNPKGTYPSFYDWILENVNKGVENFKSTNIYYFTTTIDGTENYRATTTRNPIVGSTVYNVNLSANRTEITGTVTSVNGDTITVTDTYKGTLTLTFKQISSASIWLTDYDFVINTTDETFRLPLLNGEENIISDKYDELTPEVGAKYVAPANGVYCFNGTDNAVTGKYNVVLRRSDRYYGVTGESTNYIAAWTAVKLDVRRGNAVNLYYVGASQITDFKFRFYYATGNGSLYYYVGETVQNDKLMDAGRIGEILPTKLDASKVKAYIVETYRNGNSWYRIYSDGWCEQGGRKTGGSGYGVTTVYLLKPFINTDYWVHASRTGLESSWFTGSGGVVQSGATDLTGIIETRLPDRFTMQSLGYHLWYACGYIR